MSTPPVSIEAGSFHPLGASYDGRGVNFALFSEHATSVELCLFDDAGSERRVAVPWRSLNVWHVFVAGLGPGQRYGWRVNGPFAPERGDRFNPNKLLVDPYARAIEGFLDTSGPVYGYPRERGADDLVFDPTDDAAFKPKGVVVSGAFDWGDDRAPAVHWCDTAVYELHVKGFTKLHPEVSEVVRGTFLGLASEPAISHLKALGVTTVELLPVHEHVDEPAVSARGLTNYWGYSTLAYFAPDRRFATRGGDPTLEFKQMVKRLHAAGIEVVLDVVYNHTCEGDELGPTVSLRGIDNRVYYRLDSTTPREYVDYTGCGNTVDAAHPQVLKLLTDSLRHWVTEMHVDGFRFDLAPSLARGNDGDVDRVSAFFSVIHQDPVLSRIKLIAEPWDLGHGGYQSGNFPILWTEWNGRFRDTVRRFWRGERGVLGDLGYRVTGSSDLFADDGRHPHASINFVAAHDGFTLRDLVSYETKHNADNGEANRDGLDENMSQNCGVEGETSAPLILAMRGTIARSLFGTLVLSQGVPMIAMGDEMWRTQRGNNNAYCHDSELTWVDWSMNADARAMLDACRAFMTLRKRHPVFRRWDFLVGAPRGGSRAKDITWLGPDGAEMTETDWTKPERAILGFVLRGDAFDARDGEPMGDDSFLVLLNGEREETTFVLPDSPDADAWRVVIDTGTDGRDRTFAAGSHMQLQAGALAVLVAIA